MLVACKKTNEYCEDLSKLNTFQISKGIGVKDGHDELSDLSSKELFEYFKGTDLLLKLCKKAGFPTEEDMLSVNIKAIKPSTIARVLRYHLRGLSEEQTIIKLKEDLDTAF